MDTEKILKLDAVYLEKTAEKIELGKKIEELNRERIALNEVISRLVLEGLGLEIGQCFTYPGSDVFKLVETEVIRSYDNPPKLLAVILLYKKLTKKGTVSTRYKDKLRFWYKFETGQVHSSAYGFDSDVKFEDLTLFPFSVPEASK